MDAKTEIKALILAASRSVRGSPCRATENEEEPLVAARSRAPCSAASAAGKACSSFDSKRITSTASTSTTFSSSSPHPTAVVVRAMAIGAALVTAFHSDGARLSRRSLTARGQQGKAQPQLEASGPTNVVLGVQPSLWKPSKSAALSVLRLVLTSATSAARRSASRGSGATSVSPLMSPERA